MKLIASDFDGTINRWGHISAADRYAIAAWQRAGNAFGIVTGRGREILGLAAKLGVTLDYAVTLNGAQIVDRDGTVLHEEVFDRALQEMYFAFVNQFPQSEDGTVQYAKHDPDGADTDDNIYGICQFSLVMPTDADAEALTDRLNEEFGDTLVSFANGRCINTVKKGVSKATGIAEYAKRVSAAREDIFAVGDARNDIPMLTAYDGWCVRTASAEMKRLIPRHVENMTELCAIAQREDSYRYLYQNLQTRRTLRFREDGTFRILTYSDLHAKNGYCQETLDAVRRMVDYTKPDLVLINGDIIHKMDGDSTEEKRENIYAALRDVMAVLEEKRIPWAHVFGNHDDNCGVSDESAFDLYTRFSHCESKHGPEEITGTGNYVLPIWKHDGSGIALNVWGMSSRCTAQPVKGKEGAVLPEHYVNGDNGDMIRFDQQMWYWNSSVEMERYLGNKIPGFVYFHVPLQEFKLIPMNPVETKMRGTYGESMGCPELNSGFFATVLQRGDIMGILCGHEHYDDYEGTYCGIRMCFDGVLSYDGYGKDTTRGARVIDLREDDVAAYKTYMVHLKDIP